jgi:hypothetical protein
MNKLYLTLSVLCILAHATGWAMLTVNKIQPRPSKKYFTQEKIEKDEWRVSEESQRFLNSFGQHSTNKTGKMFCDLSTKTKKKVLPCLSHNQKVLLWCGINDVEIPFLSAVFNDNEKVALMYSQRPIGEILEAYASAKEMMKWCPLNHLKEQHYMVLKNGQRIILSSVGHTIHHSDIPQFMAALRALDNIDPELIDGMKWITNQIKIYPSLSQRANIFYGMIPINAFRNTFLLTSAISTCLPNGALLTHMFLKLLLRDKCRPFPWQIVGIFTASIQSCFMIAFTGIGLKMTYASYQDHLETNILPNQPSLTDYLKKKPS